MSKVDPRSQNPIRIIVLVFVLDVALLCLALGSSLAFAAVTSVTTIGYQARPRSQGDSVLHDLAATRAPLC